MAKKDKKADAAPPPAPRPVLWEVGPECLHCGAIVDQAEACRSERPTCRYCNQPLQCTPVPQPQAAPQFAIPGMDGPMSALVGGAMQMAMGQANDFFGPGGPAQMYATSAVLTNGASVVDSRAHLVHSGIATRGSLIEWSDLGLDTGQGRVMQLRVDTPNGQGGTYPAFTKTVVPHNAIPRLTAGMDVSIRIDPNDPYAILIVWPETLA